MGTSYVRTHTDVDPEIGLAGIEAVHEAAARCTGQVTLQQVAFPQHGLLTNPGTAELLGETLKRGSRRSAALTRRGSTATRFGIWMWCSAWPSVYGVAVDFHLHDGGSLGAWELELIAERTAATGLQGRVTVSHAYGFSEVDEGHQGCLIDRLAEADVTILTAAVYSFPCRRSSGSARRA